VHLLNAAAIDGSSSPCYWLRLWLTVWDFGMGADQGREGRVTA
jgi:hypothetical protein